MEKSWTIPNKPLANFRDTLDRLKSYHKPLMVLLLIELMFTSISCTKVTQPSVNFTIDLSSPSMTVLKVKGGYLYDSGVIIALDAAGNYIAVSQVCTFDGTNVVYDITKNAFYCNSDYSTYNTSGVVVSGPSSKNLKVYTTTLTGTTLKITG